MFTAVQKRVKAYRPNGKKGDRLKSQRFRGLRKPGKVSHPLRHPTPADCTLPRKLVFSAVGAHCDCGINIDVATPEQVRSVPNILTERQTRPPVSRSRNRDRLVCVPKPQPTCATEAVIRNSAGHKISTLRGLRVSEEFQSHPFRYLAGRTYIETPHDHPHC